MNGFAPEEVTQRGADPAAAAAAVVGNAGSAVEVPPPPAPPGLGPAVAAAAGLGAGGAGGPGAGQLCCLREEGERCGRAAGNASFSKRIQKSISQKKVKIELDKSARHLYICDFHKNLIQSVRNRRKRKGSDDDGDSPVQDIDTPEVDLYQLQVNTLRRYKRHFKLQTRPGLNKAQLVEIIGCHFRTIPVNEKDTLTYFIYSVKNEKNKPDLKMDSGVH
ncbi:histone deacetylase complex subunit SAP30 [Neopsephotus bourkii]|uniref:histone deacetylase complex subunit SAP30 n=1 Tax=Neopsephotus bourkii TaxID=309878 RepID=UPI002AA5D13B|nr:histone deacetylase complex subunit SAP30 [Neopsephotus bourkii]